MASKKRTEVALGSHKIALDCPDDKIEELKRRLNLLSWGTGEDICVFVCNKKGHRAARLVARIDENIGAEARECLTNGAIELAAREQISGFITNHSEGCYGDCDKPSVMVHFAEKGLRVAIRW